MARGVLYLRWNGNRQRVEETLQRSIDSLAKWHPELPYHVVDLPDGSTYLDKAKMLDLSPFETTIYLDVDTVVLGRLDYAIGACEQYGLACCINENPWANRHGGIKTETIEYNCGVMFFTRAVSGLFETWKKVANTIDSSVLYYRDQQLCIMEVNDQAGFAAACRLHSFNPHVLPLNYNYRPTWQPQFCGPVKIWHDWSPVAKGLEDWNANQSQPDAVIESAVFRVDS